MSRRENHEPAGSPAAGRRDRWGRRLIIVVLLAFLVLGASGFLGVRSATVADTAAGWTLEVTYARVARGGLEAPWGFRVHKDGGFEAPIQVATTLAYLDLFDENGLNPDPAAAFIDGDLLVWEFEPPEGDTLAVAFDARVGPSVQRGMGAETMVLVDGAPVVRVAYETRVMP